MIQSPCGCPFLSNCFQKYAAFVKSNQSKVGINGFIVEEQVISLQVTEQNSRCLEEAMTRQSAEAFLFVFMGADCADYNVTPPRGV